MKVLNVLRVQFWFGFIFLKTVAICLVLAAPYSEQLSACAEPRAVSAACGKLN